MLYEIIMGLKLPWIVAVRTRPASAAVVCAPALLMPSHP